MTQAQFASPPLAESAPAVRRIGWADLRWALAEGWKDFQDRRGELLVLTFIYPLVAYLAAAVSFNGLLMPMFFPLVAGLSILGPAVASGFYELARRRELGLDAGWRHFLDPFLGRSRMGLMVLTGGLAALFLLWLGAAWMIYAATLGKEPSLGALAFLSRTFTSPEGWTMIVIGNIAGGAFAVATLVLAFVSFPMIVDKGGNPSIAVETSVRAATTNPLAVGAWGLIVTGLLLVGCLTAFVGLAVVLPVLGYTSWHLYTRLVER
jgi:uncharacterized membrane protein